MKVRSAIIAGFALTGLIGGTAQAFASEPVIDGKCSTSEIGRIAKTKNGAHAICTTFSPYDSPRWVATGGFDPKMPNF